MANLSVVIIAEADRYGCDADALLCGPLADLQCVSPEHLAEAEAWHDAVSKLWDQLLDPAGAATPIADLLPLLRALAIRCAESHLRIFRAAVFVTRCMIEPLRGAFTLDRLGGLAGEPYWDFVQQVLEEPECRRCTAPSVRSQRKQEHDHDQRHPVRRAQGRRRHP